MYTDGLIEATRDVVAGVATLRDVVASPELAGAKNAAEFVHERVTAGGAEMADDVAIVTLAVLDLPVWEWHFTFVPGAADMQLARLSLARALDAANAHDCSEAQVILGELLSNVLRYAPGPSDVRLECGDDRVVLHVLDRGPGFDPDGIGTPAPLSESMRGLMIVRALSQSLTIVEREGGGMHVAASLCRRPAR
jgi:anti-sigma regulatory factor (Ser/Thr protein kinase)